MKKNNDLNRFIPIIIIGGAIILLFLAYSFLNKDETSKYKYGYVIQKSKYSNNEYIPILVSDEQMSRKYILDFLNTYYRDYKEAYNILDEEYRNETFGNYDKFKNYMEVHKFTYEIDSYSVYGNGKYQYYDVYDKNGNRIIFKTSGVMQYSVMFEK